MERQLSPGMLPIAKYEATIVDLIDRAPAVVISGKTGCGKSTQVPQFILRRHPQAKIIICQPRRVAATSLAVRVSEELGCKLGSKVGYHIGMESFRQEKCSIVYMTYGILIQQLLFMEKLPYTHIILDEIHERSLEMDFTFVTLKKIINAKYQQRVKLIVMSATLNADLFCDYFCSNQVGQFHMPELREAEPPRNESRRGRNRQEEVGEHFQLIPPGREYKPALRLQLQQQKLFKVEELYLDDLNQKDYYFGDEEQRINEDTFTFAVSLIKKLRKEEKQGDYLVFLPGLYQIKAMKELLMKEGIAQKQVIQVHSLFSDELYQSLFDSTIKNKVILATNIGQSSITLPFCRVVIDFCLTRKNHSKDRGVTRLQTRLASQASMTQRSGRVGRVSDGTVYRLITRELYEKLPPFQKPQIQCVSLEMVVLRAKQLDLANKNDIFRNPYYFLMATLNPPHLNDIRRSLQLLVHEEALMGEQGQKSPLGVREADRLCLTDIGKFMVEMPCQLRISKMILMGLRLRIPERIIAVASVLMLTKQFFLHEERRFNMEEWMHSLIGYDRGLFNDYLLRQNLFAHWREEFYDKSKEKRLFKRKKYYLKDQKPPSKKEFFQRIYESEQGAEQVLSFLQEFNQEKWSQKEKEWCSVRGVSPNTMRELIKIEESLKLRICAKNFKLLQKEHPSNELLLLCIEYGFPENDCDVKWSDLAHDISSRPNQSHFYIELPDVDQTRNQFIEEYVRPQKGCKIEVNKQTRTKRIYGNTSILAKFILPKAYTKGETKNTSQIYSYLAKTNVRHKFASELTLRHRPITILNESICKGCLPYNSKSKFKLLTHKFTQMGAKKMTGMGALIQQETYFMMQILLNKKIELILHPSEEYFCGFRTSEASHPIVTALQQEQIDDIMHYRGLISHGKQTKISSREQMLTHEDCLKLVRLLRGDDAYTSHREVWQHRYQIGRVGNCHQKCYPIDNLPQLKMKTNYMQAYKNWKLVKYSSFYNMYRPMIMENIFLICRQCHQREIVQIEQIAFYQHEEQILKLNEYSGSWKIPKQTKDLCCKYGHTLGRVIDEENAKMERKALLLYIPYKRVEELWDPSQWRSKEEMEEMVTAGKEEVRIAKQELREQECIFCFDYAQTTGEPIFKRFQRAELGKNYLKKYMDHMRSQQHINNIVNFRKNIPFSQQ